MLHATMASPRKTPRKAPAPAPARADGRGKSALTLAGETASREAKRELLLKTLEANDWNLSATARALELSGTPAVIRALNDVAPDAYERATRDARIKSGPRN